MARGHRHRARSTTSSASSRASAGSRSDFKGGEIFHNAWVAGLFVAVGLTGLAVLLATLFNLITDLVGGVRVSVLEEEVLARRDRTARMVVEDDPDADAPYDQARSG